VRKKSFKRGNFSGAYRILIVVPLLISFLFLGAMGGVAQSDENIAEQYAPILYFEQGEMCYPVDVSYHIDNSYLYQFTGDEPLLIDESPSDLNLSVYVTGDYYLDNVLGTTDDENIIQDYQNKFSTLGYRVYCHIHQSGGTTVVQYWMFYAFNKGELNQHEGDWEMVQIVLSGGTPTDVMYSQHHGGQRATWDQVERDGDHIKVYVARGSHANYLRSYSGKFGVASDIVGANGKILESGDYTLELLESQDWLNFAGRWGEFDSYEDVFRGKVGPPGPMYREDGVMWNSPVDWGNGLSQADNNIFLFEWFLYNIVTIFLIVTAVSISLIVFRIYRRHKKHGLGPRIVSMFYIDGFNIKSIGNILCIVGIIIAVFGLFNLWYVVSIDINVEDFETAGTVDMMTIDGIDGVKINLLDPSSGPVQLGSLSIPFSLFIGLGLVFLVLATIGISSSKKLGRKYITRGIKLLIPIIIILAVIMALGTIPFGSVAGGNVDSTVEEILGSISSAPLGGQKAIPVYESGVSGQISFQWGLGLGGQLLLVAAIILLVAGIMEIIAKTSFFKEKVSDKSKKLKPKKSPEEPLETQNEEAEEIKLPKPIDSEEQKKE
jgi:VPS62-like protein